MLYPFTWVFTAIFMYAFYKKGKWSKKFNQIEEKRGNSWKKLIFMNIVTLMPPAVPAAFYHCKSVFAERQTAVKRKTAANSEKFRIRIKIGAYLLKTFFILPF